MASEATKIERIADEITDDEALDRRLIERQIQSELAYRDGCTGNGPKTHSRCMTPKIIVDGDCLLTGI